MPFFSTTGHKLRSNYWLFQGHKVEFHQASGIVEQLKRVQGSRKNVLQPLALSTEGGSLNAKYRFAFAPLGRPQYFEYCLHDGRGNSCCFLNGLVGYLDTNKTSHGVIFAATSRAEMSGHYHFTGSGALVNFSGNSTSFTCHWEAATLSEGSSGMVYVGPSKPGNEICRINGQSRRDELNGLVSRHVIFHGKERLMEIYPEGRWRYNPVHIWKMYMEDTVPVIDYSPYFAKWMSRDTHLGQGVMLFALGVCRALQWPLKPFESAIGP